MRRSLELNHDFRSAFGEALSGAEIERDTGPAPIVDEDAHGDEGFGARCRADAGLLAIAGKFFAVELAGRVLAANDGLRDAFEIVRANGLKHF